MLEKLKQDWHDAAVFCNRVSTLTGVAPAIRHALKKGERRDGRHHRVIVHPEFPWNPNIYDDETPPAITTGNDAFAAAIQEILATHPDSIVLRHPGPSFGPRFSHPRTVLTAPRSEVAGSIVGDMDAQGAKDFLHLTDGIHPDDTFTIDGAALNRCPTRAAQQIFGLMEWHVFIPPSSTMLMADNPRVKHTDTMRKVMFQLQLLRKRFRCGILHDTFDEKVLKGSGADLFHPNTVIIPHSAA